MRGTRGIVHNLGILTAAQITAQLLNLWALVYLADKLGSHWFGVVQIGVAFLAYALVTAEWGMFSLGIREISRLDEPSAILRYARTHLGLMSLQAVAVLGVGLLILPRLPFWGEDPWVFVLYLSAVLLQVSMLMWIGVGLERVPWVGAVKSLRSLIYGVLVLLALVPLARATGLPLQRGVPMVYLVSLAASNLVMAWVARRWFGCWLFPALPGRDEMKRRWRESAPMGAGVVVLRVLLGVDMLVLGSLAAPAVAGQYAAASRMIFLLITGTEVLWSALLPRLSRLATRDRDGFRRAFNQSLGFVLAVLLPVAVGGNLTGAGLVDLLYGAEYSEAGPVFRVLAVSYSLLAVAMFLGNTLVADDRQAAYLPPLAVTAAVAVTATAVMVPRWGAVGASGGMLLAHGCLALALVFINRRLFNRLLGRLLFMLLPALAAMILMVRSVTDQHVLVQVGAGGAVYVLLAAFPLLWFRRQRRVETA